MQFRRPALARLDQVEEPDVPVVLADPQTLILLILVTLVVMGVAVWAFVGSVSRTVYAPGILADPAGRITVRSPASGLVDKIYVAEDAAVLPGTALFTVTGPDGSQVVRTATAGRIVSLLTSAGQKVSVLDALAVIEHDDLAAVVYLPPAESAGVQPGQRVDLEVSSAPKQRFGTLRGTVSSIGSRPQTRGQLTAFLADPDLAGDFLAAGEPIKVIVRLTPGRTPSGYRWSTPQGSPRQLGTHTLLQAAIHLPSVKPVSLVVS